uniref:Costars domain-containing protein n=1 Tax=Strigamia maritima TaxID=126957 RepID=T1JD57_STRMM
MAHYKEPPRIYGSSGLSSRVALFNKTATEHTEKQLKNPFSNWTGASHTKALSKDDVNYGRPVQGSKTEYRGKKAGELISSEIQTLCQMIWEFGSQNDDGTAAISFGELFQIYTRISNKVVGILLRARRNGLLHFEGEMLYQRRDDDVIISLLESIGEIRRKAGWPEHPPVNHQPDEQN